MQHSKQTSKARRVPELGLKSRCVQNQSLTVPTYEEAPVCKEQVTRETGEQKPSLELFNIRCVIFLTL